MPPLRPAVVAWVIVIGVIVGSLLGVISEDVGNAAGVLVGLVAVWFGISLWTAQGSTEAGGHSAAVASWGSSARTWAAVLIVGGAVVAIVNLIALV